MNHNPQRQEYLARRHKTQSELGALTHPAAPLPEETADDKRKTRNARKQLRRSRRGK